MESFFGVGKQEAPAEVAPAQEQARASSPLTEEQLAQRLADLDRRIAFEATLPGRLANLDQRMEAQAQALEAQEQSRKQQSLAPPRVEKQPEEEHEHELGHGFRDRAVGTGDTMANDDALALYGAAKASADSVATTHKVLVAQMDAQNGSPA